MAVKFDPNRNFGSIAMFLFGFDFAPYQKYLPHLVGCGVAAGVFATIVGRKLLLGSGGRNSDANRPKGLSEPGDNGSFGDRNSLRREGQPVLVHIASPAFHGTTRDGWILDRSTGGLRIQIATQVAPGTAIQLIADNAPDTIPWVTAIVRSCKPVDRQFELGCEFETTPPWNVLLLFG
jgi:PilZ domain